MTTLVSSESLGIVVGNENCIRESEKIKEMLGRMGESEGIVLNFVAEVGCELCIGWDTPEKKQLNIVAKLRK